MIKFESLFGTQEFYRICTGNSSVPAPAKIGKIFRVPNRARKYFFRLPESIFLDAQIMQKTNGTSGIIA